MAEERILITKCSSDCRNLRFMDEEAELAGIEPGYYCAAYLRGGWEKIDPKECDTCTREKYLVGITRQEAIECMAKAIARQLEVAPTFKELAQAALDALLEE